MNNSCPRTSVQMSPMFLNLSSNPSSSFLIFLDQWLERGNWSIRSWSKGRPSFFCCFGFSYLVSRGWGSLFFFVLSFLDDEASIFMFNSKEDNKFWEALTVFTSFHEEFCDPYCINSFFPWWIYPPEQFWYLSSLITFGTATIIKKCVLNLWWCDSFGFV